MLEVGLMYNMSIPRFDRVSFGGNNGGRRPNTDVLAATSAPAPYSLTKYRVPDIKGASNVLLVLPCTASS